MAAFESSFRDGKNHWNQVLEIIRKNLDPQVFEAWFKRFIFVGWERVDRTFYIGTRIEVARSYWVTSYYANLLERAFAAQSKFTGHEIKRLVAESVKLKKALSKYLTRAGKPNMKVG